MSSPPTKLFEIRFLPVRPAPSKKAVAEELVALKIENERLIRLVIKHRFVALQGGKQDYQPKLSKGVISFLAGKTGASEDFISLYWLHLMSNTSPSRPPSSAKQDLKDHEVKKVLSDSADKVAGELSDVKRKNEGLIRLIINDHYVAMQMYGMLGYQPELSKEDNAVLVECTQASEHLISLYWFHLMSTTSSSTSPSSSSVKQCLDDPVVKKILNDPFINEVLEQVEQDPMGAQERLTDPEYFEKFKKLVEAGVVKLF
uniref:STI1/HOP DP domain-containing protein n=1 Tax=Ditylenchus dipsaci TaxID=166011 RepID=A0A915EHP0_9BILA